MTPVMYIDSNGTSPQLWQIAFTVGVAAIAIGAIILTAGAASAGIAPLLFADYGISASTTFALTMTAASLVSVGIAAFAVADIQSIVTQGNNNYLGFLGHYYEGARTTLYASAMLFPYASQYAQPGWGRQTSGNEKASQYGPKYGKYTKTSQGGNDVTIYNGRGQAIYRFDSSHSHGGMQPHTHIFQWWKYEGKWRWDGHRGTVVPSIYYIY